MTRDYRKIIAWQLSDAFVKEIYKLTKNFPKEEVYGITSQLRRAAVSVPTNIVEGSTRKNKKEYLQFLYIAKGSLAEAEYLLNLSYFLKFLNQIDYQQSSGKCEECLKTLSGLISAVAKEV